MKNTQNNQLKTKRILNPKYKPSGDLFLAFKLAKGGDGFAPLLPRRLRQGFSKFWCYGAHEEIDHNFRSPTIDFF